jgi:hypothetical protein
MGGDVGVLSELNVGSVFWMTARLRLASDGHQSDKNLGMEPLRDTLARSFGGIRVLVTEDEPLNQEVARILLEDAGLVPDMVNNGQKAVGTGTHWRLSINLGIYRCLSWTDWRLRVLFEICQVWQLSQF